MEDQDLSRRERRKLFREEKKGEQVVNKSKDLVIKWLLIFSTLGLLAAGGWWVIKQPGIPEEEIVSRKGIHWHPELVIFIKGEKQEIPTNLGLGAVHQPIHTHDSTGVLHLEMQGLVKKEDTELGQFFKIWGKQFSANCILDFCNSEGEKVKMSVNGQENIEFENYLMRDKDKIEIRYGLVPSVAP